MVQVEWRARDGEGYAGGPPPSEVHGWLLRIGGFFLFNKRWRRSGRHEIQDAKILNEERRSRKERHRRRRDRRSRRQRDEGRAYHSGSRSRRGFFSKLFGRRRRSPEILVSDDGYSRTPWGHYHRRCRPSYHGNHHRFWGWLTRNEERMRFGHELRERALKERRRERRRRLQRLEEEGLAIRLGRSLRAR